jgi:hypothetical protein
MMIWFPIGQLGEMLHIVYIDAMLYGSLTSAVRHLVFGCWRV